MRKILYIFIIAIVSSTLFSCTKHLETSPTDSVGSDKVFSSASNAMAAINGMYRAMYSAQWGPGWQHENGGLPAYILASDLMAEDHIQNKSGSGWFWYDYTYGIASDFTNASGRQTQCWNFFYTLICNANIVLANEANIQDNPSLAKSVIGQAYAIRGFSYLWLVQAFQQNDATLPGVPVYTEPTTTSSEGKPRGTVQQVYDRLNEDLALAVQYLSESSESQKHISHIDKYIALGFRARAALVQHNYADALTFAKAAMEKPGVDIVSFSETNKVNDVAKKNVMWGLAIQTDQALNKAGIYAHIDADSGDSYSKGAQFLISQWLYESMPDTDARKAWWTANIPKEEQVIGTSKLPYVQVKMVYKDPALGTGDYILMRVEEMALVAAEAACHLGQFDVAREYVAKVTSKRDSDYEDNLNKYPNSSEYSKETSISINTLMDYILFQRRVELWGEVSRMHDLQRLGLGLNRKFEVNNNHINKREYPAAYKTFIYAIPQKEFDGNINLDPGKDQNPL